jgi:hypothetical protein
MCCLQDMEGGGEPFPPYAFLMCLREKFPQFAQTGQGGIHAQQDAEECMTSVIQALRERLKASGDMVMVKEWLAKQGGGCAGGTLLWRYLVLFLNICLIMPVVAFEPTQNSDGSSKVEELFGVKTTLKLKCEESGEELQVQGEEDRESVSRALHTTWLDHLALGVQHCIACSLQLALPQLCLLHFLCTTYACRSKPLPCCSSATLTALSTTCMMASCWVSRWATMQ